MAQQRNRHIVVKQPNDPQDLAAESIWRDVMPVCLEHYLWMENGYAPEVRVKIFHTSRFLYLYYHVGESEVAIRHTAFGSPVYKDSCVEFFLNPFPEQSCRYFNMEFNALGTMLIGVGSDGDDSRRYYLNREEIRGLEVVTSIREPIIGSHGTDHWKLYLRIPKEIFEKRYGLPFTDKKAIGNFYKCGDETAHEHYGAWNRVVNESPNFHLPEWFGELVFAP